MRASRPEAWFEKAEHDLVMIQKAMVGAPDDPTEAEARRALDIAVRVRDEVLQRVPGQP